MTPTLLGRWQIRIFLLATVGLVISLIVSLIVGNNMPLFALLYVLLFGLVWDVIYQFITSFRWDRDWPTCYQVAAGVIEGALVWGLILTKKLPGIPEPPPFIVFLIQYAAIWLSIFLLTQGPLRIFSINWRYQGGQWFMSHRAAAGANSYQQPPTPATLGAGWYNPQPSPLPQVAAGNYVQQPVSGLQPPAPPPRPVRPGYHDHRHSQEKMALQQLAQPYVCDCGLALDRTTGNFCPRCGRIKVHQRVS